MKRKERRQIKQDQLVSGVARFIIFIKDKKEEIFKIGLVLAGVAVIVFALYLLKRHNENVQSKVASEIISLSAELSAKPENLTRLEKIAGRGMFNRLAYIELAKHWLTKGDDNKAEEYIRKFPDHKKDLLYSQSQYLLARILTSKKDYDGAVGVYKKILDLKQAGFPLDLAMLNLAEVLELKGSRPEARDYYERIQREYGQTPTAYEASLRASRLALRKD